MLAPSPKLDRVICPEVAGPPWSAGQTEDLGGIVGITSCPQLRSVLSRYSDTLLQQVLTAGCGLISGTILPRLLGPVGRGKLAAVTLWPITLIFLSNLGMDRAAVFFAAKHRQNISPIASVCLAFAGAQSLLVFFVGLLAIPIALRGYGPTTVRLGLTFLLCAPLTQATNLQSNLLLGNLETGSYNVCRAIAPASYAIGVVGLFLLRLPSVTAVVVLQLFGYALAACFATRTLLRKLRPSWRRDSGIVKAMLKYGAKTHGGQLTYFMNQRLDQLLISLFLPSAQLGIYVAAVAFTDGLLMMPRAIGAVTLGVGSNCDAVSAWRWAKRSVFLAFLCILPAAIALWFLSPFLIPRLFGTAFSGSVLPCRILIFGSCALGLSTVLCEAARSVNSPEIPSYAELVGLVVTFGLLGTLLKPYGIIGAAVASTAAYTSTLVFVLGYLFLKPAPSCSQL
jgi:O-antigen/teichoic acid export membrane protein